MSPISSEVWSEVNLQGSPASVLRELKEKVWNPDRGSNGILIYEEDSLRVTPTFAISTIDKTNLDFFLSKDGEERTIPGMYIGNEYNPKQAFFIPEPVLARVESDEQAIFLRLYIFVIDKGQVLQVKMIERSMQRTEIHAAWKLLKFMSEHPNQANQRLEALLNANVAHIKVYTGEEQLNNAFTQFRKDFNLEANAKDESV